MDFKQFVNTYLGKATDYDGGYGVQCVDLIKLYADKVLGLKLGTLGNAHDYYDNFDKKQILKENFYKIPNTPSFVPQLGDIVVWNTNRGNGNGHIAICTGEGTTKWFNSYDQNWNNNKKMKKYKHDYKNVSGFLRPKDQTKLYDKLYKQGQAVEVHIPVQLTGAIEGDNVMVDTNGYQYWVHKSVIKNGQIIARAIVAYAEPTKCLIQIFDRQFWCDTKFIVKKLD